MDNIELDKLAEELVSLSLKEKQLKQRIKTIKGTILEHCDINNISDQTWSVDNGHVCVTSQVKNKLVDIPFESKISPEVVAIDVAEKAFSSKLILSREGKKMVKNQEPSIMKLVIPCKKQIVKIII